MLENLTIPEIDPVLAEAVQGAIDIKTKPPGSLGRIEALARQMAVAQGTPDPRADPAVLLLFAADHGIVAEGVSAWPQDVTAQMVLNFLSGGAAACVFARSSGAEIRVVDAGVVGDLADTPALLRAGLPRGTRNAAVEDAMTGEEMTAALSYGATLARSEVTAGACVIAVGEMGIGNTSAAALLAHAITGTGLDILTGPGAGLDAPGVSAKRAVLERAAARHPEPLTPAQALSAFGGFEIACMAGALIGAASARAVGLVDGFIASAAALVAVRARPEIAPFLVFAHRSAEPGHRAMLDAMDADPLMDLDLRLGEGSGALLALPHLRAATAMLAEMATFESAGVSGKTDP